jgi:hypothetical protein
VINGAKHGTEWSKLGPPGKVKLLNNGSDEGDAGTFTIWPDVEHITAIG